MEHANDWDVLVIGRSFAGLSAALMLGRARRSVLVVGTGGPRNEGVSHAHGLLTRDHEGPVELIRIAEEQLGRYPTVQLLDERVTSLESIEVGFAAGIGPRRTTARFVILATGVNDDPPPIPGVADHWGRGVFTCPYCDGWEHRDLPLAVIGDPTFSPHGARLLRGGWSDQVTLFAGELDPATAVDLRARGVVIDDREVARVHGDGTKVTSVELTDGGSVAVGAIFCATMPKPNHQLASALGAEIDEFGFVVTDAMRAATVPGLWAVGDVQTRMHQMSGAIADGAFAGALINGSLVEEQVPPQPG